MYIVSQILRFIACSFSIASDYQNDKKKLYLLNGIANFLQSISYFMIGAISGSITSIIAILRNVFIYLYKGNKMFLYFIIFMFMLIFSSIFCIKCIYDILPIIMVFIYTGSLFLKNIFIIKLSIIIVDILNIIYDVYYGSIIGVIFTILSLLLTIISEIKYFSNKRKDVKV